MIGVWIAAEDIHPGAGPFYVYARSHRTPTPPDLELDRIDPNGPEYKRRMAAFAGGSALRLVAPELEQGDMILWSSLTIHGSLATTQPDRSRRSFTAHYIPASQTYLWGRKAEGSNREFDGQWTSRSPCTATVRAARSGPVCAGPSGCWRPRRRRSTAP